VFESESVIIDHVTNFYLLADWKCRLVPVAIQMSFLMQKRVGCHRHHHRQERTIHLFIGLFVNPIIVYY